MPYDRRSRAGPRLPRLALWGATASVFAGVVAVMVAVFAASLFESVDGQGEGVILTQTLLTPFVYLFEGGMVTAGGGFLLMIGGLAALVTST
ncbi:MAG: hypothetical protein ABEH64_03245 [Salinirussus sp.]